VVFFPLDSRLGLTAHSWSRQTIEHALRLGVEIASFGRAAASFTALTGVPLSKSALHRLAEEYGTAVVAAQAAEAQAMVAVPRGQGANGDVVWRQRVTPDSATMAVSSDGVLIHIRDEGWKEVKVVSVSAVSTPAVTHAGAAPEGEHPAAPDVVLHRHSYRAGLWDAATFAHQHWAEAVRRGVDRAQTVVCVSDGAAWIWAIVFMCFAVRVEVLDFWHATQRLWTIARQRFATETEATQWVAAQRAALAQSRLRHVMHQVRQLYPRHQPLPADVRQALGYLFHNRRRMDYAACRQAGYPIGSGTIESACKTVVQARMKQAGMRWSRDGAQAMLALRTLLLSDRWHDLPSPSPPH
jgi:hypothetical protein